MRGEGALVRTGDHLYKQPDASPDQLPDPNHGVRLSVAKVIRGGELDVGAALLGATLSEPDDFGGNEDCVTCYTPEGAKDGHSFDVEGAEVRSDAMFARDNAWDHELLAVVLAAAAWAWRRARETAPAARQTAACTARGRPACPCVFCGGRPGRR